MNITEYAAHNDVRQLFIIQFGLVCFVAETDIWAEFGICREVV